MPADNPVVLEVGDIIDLQELRLTVMVEMVAPGRDIWEGGDVLTAHQVQVAEAVEQIKQGLIRKTPVEVLLCVVDLEAMVVLLV